MDCGVVKQGSLSLVFRKSVQLRHYQNKQRKEHYGFIFLTRWT